METSTQTISEVVQQIIANAGILSAVVAPITFGLLEALKKAKLPSRFAGLLSAPIGVLVCFLIQGFHFTPVGILVGVLAGLATSGTYSAVKSAVTPK